MRRFPLFVAMAFAGISLVATLMAQRAGARPNWQVLTGVVGLISLLVALLVGPEPRSRRYVLIGISLTLTVLSLAIGFAGR